MPEGTLSAFKTDEDKVAKLEELQDRLASGDAGVTAEEINRIAEIPVELDPNAAEETLTQETVEPSVKEETPEPKTEEKSNRRFVITEEMIPGETYVDPADGREKPIFSFKDPEKGGQQIVDSFIRAQRRVQHLEGRLGNAANEARQAVVQEYDGKIADLQKQLTEAKTQTPATPEPKTEEKQATPVEGNLQEVMSKLQTVNPDSDDYDPIEHTKQLSNALLTAVGTINSLKSETGALSKFRETSEQRAVREEQERKDREGREMAEKERQVKQEVWKKTCEDVDTFANKNKFDTGGLGFNEMTQGSLAFHRELARLNTGKESVTDTEMANAAAAYARETPVLIDRVQKSGTKVPVYYDAWKQLDQLDALRTGHMLDASTKQWVKKDGIMLPSLDSALREFNAITGRDVAKFREARAQGAKDVAELMNKRDTGVVQMDTSMAHGEGEGQAMTEKEAADFLDNLNVNDVAIEILGGNEKALTQLNNARTRLGLEPMTKAHFQG